MAFEQILMEAVELVAASKSLNYKKIVAHDPQELEKLGAVLRALNIGRFEQKGQSSELAVDSSVNSTVSQADRDIEAIEREKAISRRQEMVEHLTEDFEARLGRVYDSSAADRTLAVENIAHTYGLPVFDIALAPDFSPVAGLHGIFVSPLEIFSAVLPSPYEQQEWKVLKRKAYQSLEQMTEFATLLSAGFDLS